MSSSSPEVGYQFGAELLNSLMQQHPHSSCTHHETTPSAPARYGRWPRWAHPPLVAQWKNLGIRLPYVHQVATAEAAFAGTHVVVATGTSSGKSLGYLLPILTTLATDPTACALYLTPSKALGSDQLNATTNLIRGVDQLGTVHPAPYDGDTPVDARRSIRETSRFVFSNPDMVHAAMLARHHSWARLFRHLRFIVVDECHSYRGVFGAHIALVLRRLLRLARRYGAQPTVILASATSRNPGDHATMLIGEPVVAVTDDAAPRGTQTVVLWEPGFLATVTGENGAPVRRSASSEAAGLMSTLVAEGARTLTFVRSRRQAEVVALHSKEELAAHGHLEMSTRVASYRGGYLAQDRRDLEHALDDGALLGLATTNALELGVDIGGLDAVISAGFPGTVASFWQQAGRAGRRGQASLAVLVARDDPLDTYLVHHPEALLGRPVESVVFNPHNPVILADHLYCAAVESALTEADVAMFHAEDVVAQLEDAGMLRKRQAGWFAVLAPGSESPHAALSLRGSSRTVTIVEHDSGRVLGTVDAASAPTQVHPGAVYLHQGESFVVETLDGDGGVALVRSEAPDYFTYARSTTDIRIVSDPSHVRHPAAGIWISNVDVVVSRRVVGYVQKSYDGTVLAQVPLDFPPEALVTRAVAYTVDPVLLDDLGIVDIPGALHAAEHAAIGLLPLFATCDRWDIGGVSTAMHTDTGLPTVFVYDGHPGGAGFADIGFQRFDEWLSATFTAVTSCDCESGCPSCVQSPKCGNGNTPLNKAGAIALLGALVAAVSPPGKESTGITGG